MEPNIGTPVMLSSAATFLRPPLDRDRLHRPRQPSRWRGLFVLVPQHVAIGLQHTPRGRENLLNVTLQSPANRETQCKGVLAQGLCC